MLLPLRSVQNLLSSIQVSYSLYNAHFIVFQAVCALSSWCWAGSVACPQLEEGRGLQQPQRSGVSQDLVSMACGVLHHPCATTPSFPSAIPVIIWGEAPPAAPPCSARCQDLQPQDNACGTSRHAGTMPAKDRTARSSILTAWSRLT